MERFKNFHFRQLISTLALAFMIFAIYCNTDAPQTPIIIPPAETDTCKNMLPLTPEDSAFFNWPPFVYLIQNVFQSSRGMWAGTYFVYGLNGMYKGPAGFIYDPRYDRPLGFFGSDYGGWSRDGRYLLVNNGWNGISLLDIDTYNITQLTTNVSYDACWSPDEEWIYYSQSRNSHRMRRDGGNKQLVAERMYKAKPLDDDRIIALTDSGFVTFSMGAQKYAHLVFSKPVPPSRCFDSDPWALSPDRTKILVDFSAGGNFKNVNRDGVGLYLCDLQTETMRRVLPGQYWYNPYRPQWTSNSTFFATWFCRCDSTEMVHEYDLNGNVLRQVTFKEMKLYP